MLLSFDKKEDLLRFVASDLTGTQYLIMSGFQRLKRWTAVPLKPLTLLYGPNSAGKGAVFDAQNLIRMMWRENIDGLKSSAATTRWHRRESGIALSVGFSCVGSLAGMYDNDEWWDQYVPDWGQFPPFVEKLMSEDFLARPRETHRLTWIASWETTRTSYPTLELFSGEQRVAALVEEEHDSSLFPDLAGLEFYARDIRRDMLEKFLGASLTEFEFFAALRDLPPADIQTDYRVSTLDYSWEFSSLPTIYGCRFGGDNLRDFQVLLTVLFAALPRLAANRNIYIGPLRRVFSNEELKFWASGEPLRGATSPGHQRLLGNGSDVWAELAQEVAQDVLTGIFPEIAKRGGRVLDEVNRWLDSPQCFDSGYKITADVRLVIPANLFNKQGLSWQSIKENSGAKNTEAIVAFEIEDRLGRKHSLNDIGTGFSQVIPVIIGVFRELYGSLAFFEQPELHLHPKLQTVLGDLFIDALNQRRKGEHGLGSMIIESHSEHILLRLLRRIRETASSDIQHTRFSLTPEDLAVIYFEPDADETFVHHIRISPDGTFADRWPEGFFDERFDEIFNE